MTTEASSQKPDISANGVADTSASAELQQDAIAEQAPEVDYKALYEEAAAKHQKMEGDLKSIRGSVGKRQATDGMLVSLHDEVTSLGKAVHALGRAFSDGRTDELPEELGKIQLEANRKDSQNRFQSHHDIMFQELESTVLDTDGKPILDLHQAPELEDVRVAWNAAIEAGDAAGFSAAIAKTSKIILAHERDKHKQTLGELRKVETARKDTEDAESLDLNIPSSSAAGGLSDEARLRRIGDPNYDATREELAWAYQHRQARLAH